MRCKVLCVLPLLGILSVALPAQADVANFAFSGSGVSGQLALTYTPGTGGVGTITGISGVFSDSNAGLNGYTPISNASITGLVQINPVTPLPDKVIAPDFSYFPIVNGVPAPPAAEASPALSFDNNYYPAGSPVVCTDYPASGGVFDVYGVLFTLDNGKTVGVWSNGIFPGAPGPATYGVAVADATNTYDYVGNVAEVPEPATLGLMALGLAGLGLTRRRKGRKIDLAAASV